MQIMRSKQILNQAIIFFPFLVKINTLIIQKKLLIRILACILAILEAFFNRLRVKKKILYYSKVISRIIWIILSRKKAHLSFLNRSFEKFYINKRAPSFNNAFILLFIFCISNYLFRNIIDYTHRALFIFFFFWTFF